MEEKFCILHISDLHRSKEGEITNNALLSSLINDKDKYTRAETPIISSPKLIVVSGDIIRGSTSISSSESEVEEQYKEAMEFLEELSVHFLENDKSRLILIPGNHDVDWKFSKDSMTKISQETVFDSSSFVKSQYLSDAINQHKKIRWSWKDLSFYEIHDQENYYRRLEAFCKFYSNFYMGERVYSIDPTKQYDIFDYPTLNTTVVAFNSCYNNDHLRLVGDIHPDCIGAVNLRLREYKKKGRLIIATWHHNTKGLPYDANYMDSSRLKNFIDSGISLGFHGHQHKTELINEFSDVVEQKKIFVFSAGTLCGGLKELPAGTNRQYNLVEIDWKDENELIKVTLHVREKTETSSFDNPIWKPGRIDSNLISHHTVKIEKPKKQEDETVLIEIENLMRNKKYQEAKNKLMSLSLEDAFVRKFLLECIIQTEDYELALEVLFEPSTTDEFVTVLNSALQLNNKVKMKELLTKKETFTDPSVNFLIKKIEAILS